MKRGALENAPYIHILCQFCLDNQAKPYGSHIRPAEFLNSRFYSNFERIERSCRMDPNNSHAFLCVNRTPLRDRMGKPGNSYPSGDPLRPADASNVQDLQLAHHPWWDALCAEAKPFQKSAGDESVFALSLLLAGKSTRQNAFL